MILHDKDNIQTTWQIINEVIGKGKFVNKSLPKHHILNNRNIFDQKPLQIASMNILLTLD